MTAQEYLTHRQSIIAAQVWEIGLCTAHLADLRALYGHECPAPNAATIGELREIRAEVDLWLAEPAAHVKGGLAI